MELVRDLEDYRLTGKSAITIGKFDGIHKGHQKPVNSILNKKKEGLLAVIFTFNPSPAVFFGKADNKSLMTREEKYRVFEQLGVDVLVEYPLNHESACVVPTDFIENILMDKLNCRYLAVGPDVSFGNRGLGDSRLLLSYQEKGAFSVDIIEKVRYLDEEISSSRIKSILNTGDMECVRELIGYPYCITGQVVHGARLGSKMGMPTLNLMPFPEKMLPPNGVYMSYVSCNGMHYPSISNIGFKPTVSEEKRLGVETFLYNFNGNLYGENISVNLLKYVRPEKKFNSIDELKQQMESDIDQGRLYHKLL